MDKISRWLAFLFCVIMSFCFFSSGALADDGDVSVYFYCENPYSVSQNIVSSTVSDLVYSYDRNIIVPMQKVTVSSDDVTRINAEIATHCSYSISGSDVLPMHVFIKALEKMNIDPWTYVTWASDSTGLYITAINGVTTQTLGSQKTTGAGTQKNFGITSLLCSVNSVIPATTDDTPQNTLGIYLTLSSLKVADGDTVRLIKNVRGFATAGQVGATYMNNANTFPLIYELSRIEYDLNTLNQGGQITFYATPYKNSGVITGKSLGAARVYSVSGTSATLLTDDAAIPFTFAYSDADENGKITITATAKNAMSSGSYLIAFDQAYTSGNRVDAASDYAIVNFGTSSSSADKTTLEAAIDKVTGDNAANYYQSDDRYNGIDYNKDGFWSNMQPYLTAAQSVVASSFATQDEVDTATTNLTAAIEKLIPKTEVNATALYEKINSCKTKYPDNSLYTAKTWLSYNLALSTAESVLDSLYGILGNSDVSRQTVVDNAYDQLVASTEDLLPVVNYNQGVAYNDIILHLDKLFRLTDSDSSKYTAESWAAYTAARDTADTLTSEHPANESMTNPTFKLYLVDAKAYYLTCYQLVSSADSIDVHVHVADNLGAKYPQYAITDQHTAAFNSDVTLTGGNYTLADLTSAANLDFTADMTNAGNINLWPVVYVYINGVCVCDPYQGQNLDNGSVYLNDGDQVIFARAPQPQFMYYITTLAATYDTYQDYLATLTIADKDKTIEVKEGESFSLTVDKTAGAITSYPATTRPAAKVSLIYSDPADSEDSVTGAVNDSGATTDSDGKASMALYQAGWYTVSAVDIRDQTKGSVDADGNTTDGVYPTLAAGDSVIVHVVSLSDAALSAALEDYQTNLDALLANYDKDVFGPTLWKQAKSANYTAKGTVYASTSLAGAQSALDTCKLTLDSLLSQAQTANTKAVSDFCWYLDRLPSSDQIDQGLFTQGDISYYQQLATIYSGMSSYQKGQLTANQVAKYQALTTAYGADGSTLPAAKNYTLTIQCEPAEYGDKIAIEGQVYHFLDNTGLQGHAISTPFDTDNLASTFTCSFSPGDEFSFRALKAGTDSNYTIYKVDIDNDSVAAAKFTPDNYYYLFTELEESAPRADVTVTIYVRPANELTLDEAKTEANTALTTAYGTYNNSDYTSLHWSDLTSVYKDGLGAITAATTNDAVARAKETAIAAMAAVPKRGASDYGSVKVEFYNTTYADGLGYNATEPFVSETMDLAADDSMMSVSLRALNKDGYTWTGSGGSGYGISYLSSVKKDGKSLGEFDNGSQSGWMGTLNDWFTSQGFNAYTVASTDTNTKLRDGDILKIMYTSAGYGIDLGGSWGNSDTSLKALSLSGITLKNDFGSSTLNYVATVNSSLLGAANISLTPTAANKNYQVRTFLNVKNTTAWYRPGETIPAKAGDIIYIGIGDKSWPTMNSSGAEAAAYTATWYKIYVVGDGEDSVNQLSSLIDALPTKANATLADKDDIDFAKTYYDTLSTSDQAKVTNADKLNDLLDRMDDLQLIETVKGMIDDLPSAANVQLSDADAVYDATDSYNGLAQWQKDKITLAYTDKLTALKDALINLGYAWPTDYEKAISKVLSRFQNNVTNPAYGETDGEWVVLALARGNVDNDTWYNTYLTNIKATVKTNEGVFNNDHFSFDSRVVLALTALGKDASAFDTGTKTYDLVTSLLAKSGDSYTVTSQNNSDMALTLLALDSANYLPNSGKAARAAIIDALQKDQLSGGGWAESGSGFDLTATSQVLEALAPYYKDQAKFMALGSVTTYAELQTMVNDALTQIKSSKDNNYGSAENAALAVMALASLNIDADSGDYQALTALMTYYDKASGAFGSTDTGTITKTATEQGGMALIAYDRFTDSKNALFNMTDKFTATPDPVEAELAANAVTDRINALPAADKITLSDQDAVEKARAAYDNLTETQQGYVKATTLNKLTAAETTIKALADAAILPETEEKVTTLKPDATVANQIATVTLGDDTVSNLADAAKSDGATEIVIAPENDDAATAVALTMSKTALNDLLGKTTAELTFSTALGDVTLSNAALIALNNAGDGPITITVEQSGDNTIKVTIQNGDTVLDHLGAITVKFAADGITESTVVMKKNDDNTKTLLKKAVVVSSITTSTVTVTPKYSVIVPLSGSASLQLVNNSQSFSDTADHWAANNIAFVSARGLLQGTGNGKFSPDAELTRGMLVAILWRLEEEPNAAAAGFSDVSDSAYYAKAVDWAKANNIVSGVGDNKFDPDGNISRQDMVTIMARYAAYLGITANGELSHIAGYSDYSQISTYAQTAMAWAYDHKIVVGTSATKLSPTGTATRAQFAAIMERFLIYLAD